MSFRVSFNVEHFTTITDKTFRILLSVILIWPQMAWSMQDDSSTSSYSPREGVQRVISTEPLKEAEESLLEGNKASTNTDNVYEDGVSSSPLESMETSSWRGRLRWANLDNLLQRLGYALVLRKNDVTGESGCSCPVWLAGGAYPVASESARQRVLFIDGFRQGTEHVLFKALDVFLAVSIYQIATEFLDKKTPLACQHYSKSINWFDLDHNASIGLFHDILNLQYVPYIFPCLPPLWGLVKGVINTRSSDISHEEETVQNTRSSFFYNAEEMETQGLMDSSAKRGMIFFLCEDLRILANSCLSFSNYIQGRLSFEQLDEEINRYGTGNSKLAGFYSNTLRWLAPYHPIDWRLNVMMKNALWKPNVSEWGLERLKNRLELLVNTQLGYTPLSALDHVKKIAFGLNARDRKVFGIKHLGERTETYSDLKRWAFDLLQEKAGKRYKEPTESEVCSWRFQDKVNRAYARYLLWSLGQAGLCETLGFLLLKIVKLGLQVYSAGEIYRGLYQALQCPKEPGVTLAGVEPWARDLTEECFEAYVRLFNVIPGQPVETLTSNLDQYYFPGCSLSLDLSNKALDWRAVYNITKVLSKHNLIIKTLNISGNNVNTKEAFEAILPMLTEIKELDLSNNEIGGTQERLLYIPSELGRLLGELTTLEKLRLAGNEIGSNDATDPSGTIALGRGIGRLSQLISLDLSGNRIGSGDSSNSSGTIALGQGIGQLKQLRFLSLSGNGWSGGSYYYSPFNVVTAISEGISQLHQLTALDLSGNRIGSYSRDDLNSSSTITLIRSIAQIKTLLSLDLSTNMIDCNSAVAIDLGQGIGQLEQLVSLNLLGNNVYCGSSIMAVMDSLTLLHQLRMFALDCGSNTYIREINEILQNNTKAPPLMRVLSSQKDVDDYCSILPLDVQVVNLSGLLSPSLSDLAIQELMMCLSNKTMLTSIDFSNNNIGDDLSFDFDTFIQGIGQLRQITTLDLSRNHIGYCSTAFICLPLSTVFGQNLAQLNKLIFLNLSGNWIGFSDYINASGTNPVLK